MNEKKEKYIKIKKKEHMQREKKKKGKKNIKIIQFFKIILLLKTKDN